MASSKIHSAQDTNNIASGTITVTDFTSSDLKMLKREGNVVTFSCRFSGGSVYHGSPLFRLGEGFRPQDTTYISLGGHIYDSNNTKYASGLIRISPSGYVYEEVAQEYFTSGYIYGVFIR